MTALRIGIQGWGSEGDLRPLIALAARLRREGHQPQLVLTPVDGKDYVQLCRALDVPLRVVPEKMEFSLEKLALNAKSADPTKLIRAVVDLGFSPHVEMMYEAALELCGACDVVVGGSSSWYVKAASLKTGVPFAVVDYYPGVVPSRRAPPHGLSDWGVFNNVRWAILRLLLTWRSARPRRSSSRERDCRPSGMRYRTYSFPIGSISTPRVPRSVHPRPTGRTFTRCAASLSARGAGIVAAIDLAARVSGGRRFAVTDLVGFQLGGPLIDGMNRRRATRLVCRTSRPLHRRDRLNVPAAAGAPSDSDREK